MTKGLVIGMWRTPSPLILLSKQSLRPSRDQPVQATACIEMRFQDKLNSPRYVMYQLRIHAASRAKGITMDKGSTKHVTEPQDDDFLERLSSRATR
jgi:hypothetical protein